MILESTKSLSPHCPPLPIFANPTPFSQPRRSGLVLLSSTPNGVNMARGVDKVILLGNVGKDPEIRTTQGGMTVASFSLATAERAKDQTGNWTDKTEWHNLVAFQRTAEIVRDYVKKGTQLYIEGKIQTRSWDDKESGQKKYRTEILVNELTLLGGESGGEGGGGPSSSRSSSSSSGYGQSQPVSSPDYGDTGITDDDI